MPHETQLITADQLFALPSPRNRFELVRGGLVAMEPTGGRHGEVTARITWLLMDYAWRTHAGRVFGAETGFRLARDPDTVLAPDVAFVTAGRIPEGGAPEQFPELAPDLAVEVISPGDTPAKMARKALLWLELGARMVWIADPGERTVAVHASDHEVRVYHESERLQAEPVLPGFECAVSLLFES